MGRQETSLKFSDKEILKLKQQWIVKAIKQFVDIKRYIDFDRNKKENVKSLINYITHIRQINNKIDKRN